MNRILDSWQAVHANRIEARLVVTLPGDRVLVLMRGFPVEAPALHEAET